MIDDEKIIEMFFGRVEQGIRELDIKYGKVCHNLSYHIVGSRQDAEECVNDAYLGAWNAIPRHDLTRCYLILLKSFGTFHSKSIGERKQPNGAAITRLLWKKLKPV